MKKYKYTIGVGLLLVGLSAVLYLFSYLIFGEAHEMMKSITEEIAFMPIYIFITAVIAEKLLSKQEKIEMSMKMNSLVGIFFNEIGYEMIRILTKYDNNIRKIKDELHDAENLDAAMAKRIRSIVETHKYIVPIKTDDIYEIYELLLSKKDLMLVLMSNTSLIEKHGFSDLLLSVGHIIEEINTRCEISKFDDENTGHLHIDIERAYKNLINEWVAYMLYIKKDYIYLFKQAIRINPFLSDESLSDNIIDLPAETS